MVEDYIIKQTFKISESYYEIAVNSFEIMKFFLKEELITYRAFEEVINNYYLPLLDYSSKILIGYSKTAISDMGGYIEEIYKLTKELQVESYKLKNKEVIFGGLTLLLASATSTAIFICAPSKLTFTAGLSTIENSIEKIRMLTMK